MHEGILSNLVIEKVYSASTIYSEAGFKNRRTDRPSWAIVIKYEGETIYTVNEKKYISNCNNMIILPKGLDYELNCIKAGHFCIIEFQCEIRHNEILCFPIKNADKILKIFKEVEYKRNLKKNMFEMESLKSTYSIILKLSEIQSQKYLPIGKQQKLIPAIDYIAKNLNKKIKNDELAKLTGFSTDHFRKVFTQVYGISPIDYIHELKIKKAKEMLKSDYESITNIAISLGYDSIYDFSRSFKKATGIPPSKYK